MRSLCVAVVWSSLLGCADAPKRDLDRLCEIAGEVRARGDLDESTRAAELARRAEAEIESKELRNMFEAMAVVEPSKRREVLRRGAEEIGGSSWSCPALDAMFGSPAGR